MRFSDDYLLGVAKDVYDLMRRKKIREALKVLRRLSESLPEKEIRNGRNKNAANHN